MTPKDPIVMTLSRHFEASPERVFDAWLDPEAVGNWLFATPDGVMKRVEIDARVGGRFQIDEQRGDDLAQHFGQYAEIDRPRRLVFTLSAEPGGDPSEVAIEIVPSGNGCLLTLTHRMNARWADYEEQTRQGWTMILEGLAAVLAGS